MMAVKWATGTSNGPGDFLAFLALSNPITIPLNANAANLRIIYLPKANSVLTVCCRKWYEMVSFLFIDWSSLERGL